jgi:hypothetical protein
MNVTVGGLSEEQKERHSSARVERIIKYLSRI